MKQITLHSSLCKAVALLVMVLSSLTVYGQVTNASIIGLVTDEKGEGLAGATIVALHGPSGTSYGTTTRSDGRFTLPNVRIGGPYTISTSYTGFKDQQLDGINLSLGQTYRANFKLVETGVMIDEVVVTADRNSLLNSERTGAATNISKAALEAMPTLGRSLNDFVRLTPQSRSSSVASTTGSGVSFAGQDSRYNNLTLDGSIFNNSFGLASAPGGQTNSTPISLDAIEEIQVNLAPYDVRQGGFTGGGINAVTRSGTNQIQGSVFYNIRNENFVGTKAGDQTVNVNKFAVNQFGGRLGGPIIKDKLFFFVNWESERRADPTIFTADTDNDATNNGSTISKAKKADLEEVSRLLSTKYGYQTGEFQDYDFATYSNKALAKIDYNITKNDRLSFRYNYLRSYRDVPISNSGTFTRGSLRNGTEAIAFKNSNYIINNDLHSFIAELNSLIGNRMSNQFQVGFTANRDYRSSDSNPFPLIDILDGANRQYITAGYEPFTPNNRLDTDTWQAQDNLTIYKGNNTITAGVNFEYFKFDNTFTPTYYGQYIFNNMDDFRKAMNGDSVGLKRYVLTYSALPERALPTATTRVYQPGAYLQNETRLFGDRVALTYGLRVDVPLFGETALRNDAVDTLQFRDENNEIAKYSTATLPDAKFLFSPRIGFNWDVFNNKTLQVRGGTGIFSGRPPFVWISNQVGNNGILTGQIFANSTNTRKYVFSDNIAANIPADAKRPASYNLALTDGDFRFQQLWRSDLSVDKKLPFGLVGTVEGIYSRTLNNIYYINANQEPSTATFTAGPDRRPVFAGINRGSSSNPTKDQATRVVDYITDATVLKNTNKGYSYSVTAKLEKQFSNNWYAMAAYNFAEAKDIVTGGSIANSSWSDNKTIAGNNLPDLAFSDFDQRHRVIAGLSYKINYLKMASTQVSLFLQSGNQGRASLFYSGDQNGDNVNGNDLIYVPNDASELQFNQYQSIFSNSNGTKDTIRVTPAMQVAALNEYINENPFLAENKGGYIERNELLLDWLTTVDLSVVQEFHLTVGGQKQTLQIRGDIYNFGNLLNSAWGVADFISNSSPITATGTSANGAPVYTFGSINSNKAFQKPLPVVSSSATLGSVWQAQLGVRYIFN